MANNNPIHYAVPDGKFSWRAAYHEFAKHHGGKKLNEDDFKRPTPIADKSKMRVGIIGAGTAGLYAGLLLKERGIDFKIFEAEKDRVGGRIYTHRFTPEKNQYFEAGAMRLPELPVHQGVFDLIHYVNSHRDLKKEDNVELIPYVMDTPNNWVYVNGQTLTNKKVADDPATTLFGFDVEADKLITDVFSRLQTKLLNGRSIEDVGFDTVFAELVNKYDNYTLRSYLLVEEEWSEAKIDYVETMTSGTNQFNFSLTEAFMDNMDFNHGNETKWHTIADGMERLPIACAKIIGYDNIKMNSKVVRLEDRKDGKVNLYHDSSPEAEVFDRIIFTVPTGVLRSIKRPRFHIEQEVAIRSLGIMALYKIGFRFKTRFWEHTDPPNKKGQSTTDNPTRWIVYPPFGSEQDVASTLHLYCWTSDALHRLSQSKEEQEKQGLDDLIKVFGEQDVLDNFIESYAVSWAKGPAQGLATFFPGQFRNLYEIARHNWGNYYFAGEHLSHLHTWIVGAIDSALYAVADLLGEEPISPLGQSAEHTHNYNYTAFRKMLL